MDTLEDRPSIANWQTLSTLEVQGRSPVDSSSITRGSSNTWKTGDGGPTAVFVEELRVNWKTGGSSGSHAIGSHFKGCTSLWGAKTLTFVKDCKLSLKEQGKKKRWITKATCACTQFFTPKKLHWDESIVFTKQITNHESETVSMVQLADPIDRIGLNRTNGRTSQLTADSCKELESVLCSIFWICTLLPNSSINGQY